MAHVSSTAKSRAKSPSALEITWRWCRALGGVYLLVCAIYLGMHIIPLLIVHKEITVPSIEGIQEAEATATLENLGMVVKTHGDRSDLYRTGQVMSQSIPGGMHVRQGRLIYLMVCRGPVHVTIPEVRQSLSSDAIQVLSQIGLKPSIASTAHSTTIPFDSVIDVVPEVGTRLDVGSDVALIVSDGPPDMGSSAPLSPDADLGDSASATVNPDGSDNAPEPSDVSGSDQPLSGKGSGSSSTPDASSSSSQSIPLPEVPSPTVDSSLGPPPGPPPEAFPNPQGSQLPPVPMPSTAIRGHR